MSPAPAYIGLVTAFIAVMDRPFRGEFNKGPTAIVDVLNNVMSNPSAHK
ncbi:hypothetical protein [Methylocystis echinoides]